MEGKTKYLLVEDEGFIGVFVRIFESKDDLTREFRESSALNVLVVEGVLVDTEYKTFKRSGKKKYGGKIKW